MTKVDTTDLAVLEAEALAEAAEASAVAARARARAAQLRLRSQSPPTDTEAADEAATGSGDIPSATEVAEDVDGQEMVLGEDSDEPLSESSDPSPAESGDQPPRPRWARLRRPGRRTIALALAAVVIVAALGTSGYLVWQHRDVTETQELEAEFDAAARQGVVTLTSLDFNRAAADVQRVLDNSTGAFFTEFQSRSGDFTSVVEQSQVTTKGQVNASAVESMSEDSAVVLVAATSEVTNAAGAEQESRAWRLSVTVTRVDGELKMSKVEFVP